MRKFHMRPENYPYLKSVLDRDKITYEKISENVISVELSGKKFHRYVKEAGCIREQEHSEHPEILVLPYEVIENPRALRKKLGREEVFRVLLSDCNRLQRFLRDRTEEVYFMDKGKIEMLLSDMSKYPDHTIKYHSFPNEFLGYYVYKKKVIAHGILQTKNNFYLL